MVTAAAIIVIAAAVFFVVSADYQRKRIILKSKIAYFAKKQCHCRHRLLQGARAALVLALSFCSALQR